MKTKDKNKNTKKVLKTEKVLFIGSHPDDIELGCWGSLLHHLKKGDEVYAVVFSRGEEGLDEVHEDRFMVSKRAYLAVGMKPENIFLLSVPDTKFPEHRQEIFKFLEKICVNFGITKVFTHTNKEYHQDHITVYEETLRAARNVQNILTYESNAHTFPTFSPNYFIDITPYVDSKILIIKKHISQSEKKYCEMDNIKSLAKFRGYQSRTIDYSEAFEVIRMVQL
jgi:LmbE family N-acetylglucosaminyl deacetylase